jgi:4-hydroxy-tetrahydrodipicolinate synthase
MSEQHGRHRTRIISALCTPLQDDESLHVESLAMHIEDQVQAGFAGLLVGGTMGLMQLLTDATYRDLLEKGVQLGGGRLEMLVGVGDSSFARTRERIAFAQQFDIDGLVVLTPSWWKFDHEALVQYYTALADFADKPIYLYDSPSLTGVSVDVKILLELADHPNIAGIKCSGVWQATRQMIDAVAGRLRVIPAQPSMISQLIRLGIRDNLDGIYSIFPELTARIVETSEAGRWDEAESLGLDLSEITRALGRYGVMPAVTAVLNARGIPAMVLPRPLRPLDENQRAKLLDEPAIIRHLGKSCSQNLRIK